MEGTALIEARGLTPVQIDELKQYLTKMGVSPDIKHPTSTLEDLFVRVVKENSPGNGSYTGSGG